MNPPPNEPILQNEYPVYLGYFYICDGEVQVAPMDGDVSTLKEILECREVRRCDIVARNLKGIF